MKVEDYEYVEYDEFEDDITLTDDRKEELIKKVKDQIVRDNVAVHKILRIGKNNAEYNFIYDWLTKNDIRISGINGTLSGELKDYKYIKRLGIEELPEPLDEKEQEKLFIELNNMKKNGVDTDSKEYQDIRQKLIIHNIRLAIWTVGYKYARNFSDLKIENEDLQQMAMEPLIKAVDRYDASMGKKFSSYAVPTIYYTIGREWNKELNNSQQLRKEWVRLDKFEEEILNSVNRQPTDEEIKEFLGIGDERLKQLKDYINFHNGESIDNLNKDDEELLLNDLLDDERIQERKSNPILNGIYIDEDESVLQEEKIKIDVAGQQEMLKNDIEKVLDTLTEKEKKVLEMRFGLEDGNARTLKEIGKEFGVTEERIRQIEAKAFRKLRHPSRARRLEDFMDDIDSEEWNKYNGGYDEIRKKNEIVDGIKVESFNFSKKKNETNSQVQQKQLKEDEIFKEDNIDSTKEEIELKEDEYLYEEREQLEDEDIATIEEEIQELEDTEKVGEKLLKEDKQEVEEETEQYKNSLEKVKNLEEKSKSESYLDEISQLLTELNELDIMLKQTSIEIKGEKSKKQKNKELKAKLKKVEDLIQK